jgi:hypothetical protein
MNHTVDDDNFLSINWTINNDEYCVNHTVSIVVEKKVCTVNCSFSASGINVFTLSHKLNYQLVPCATYNYTIQLHGDSFEQTKSDDEITANVKFKRVENLTAIDFEDETTLGKLLTNITWDYGYAECNTTFVISIVPYDEPFNIPALIENLTSEHEITLDTLQACVKFNITVHPANDNTSTTSIDFSTSRVSPSVIRNFTHFESLSASEIFFTWAHPEYGAHCIKHYIFTYESEFHSDTEILTFPLESFLLRGVFDCVEYKFHLTTLSIDDDDDDDEELTTEDTTLSDFETSVRATTTMIPLLFDEIAAIEQSSSISLRTVARIFDRPSPPDSIEATETTLRMSTSLGTSSNKCSIDMFSFTCTAADGIEHSQQSTEDTATIESLEAYSYYSCTAKIKNNMTDWSLDSYTRNWTTAEGSE